MSKRRAPDVYQIMSIRTTRHRCVLGGVLLAAITSACDSPGGPDKNGPPELAYTVAINGPAFVAPGQSSAYTVDVRRPDGQPVSIGSVTWSSNKPLLLRVDQAGIATAAVLHGDAILQAEVKPAGQSGVARGSREILVQPEGTFRIVGTVTENGTSGFALHGARLEARLSEDLSAPMVTYATTTTDGRFWLYAVPRDAFIHVLLEGYRSTITRVQLNAHETRNFRLELETPRLVVAGTYTMTVEASSCSQPPLPENLRQRRYAATVAQDGAFVNALLTEATFANVGGRVASRFFARSQPSGIQLDLPGYYPGDYYYAASTPDVAELLPDGTVLVLSGRGTLEGTPGEVSGTLGGSMRLYTADMGRVLGYCYSPRVTLTRR